MSNIIFLIACDEYLKKANLLKFHLKLILNFKFHSVCDVFFIISFRVNFLEVTKLPSRRSKYYLDATCNQLTNVPCRVKLKKKKKCIFKVSNKNLWILHSTYTFTSRFLNKTIIVLIMYRFETSPDLANFLGLSLHKNVNLFYFSCKSPPS